MHRPRLLSILHSLFFCALFALPQFSSAEEPHIEWLKQHAIQMRSIMPADEDFSDLSALKDLLRDVQVVLLGEESHGDGTTFLAKTRLVKFLHREMGFNVLVFESGLYDCSKAWASLDAGADIKNVFRRSVWGLWSRSEQAEPLISYLGRARALGQPLEFAGMDPRVVDSTYGESLPHELRTVIDSIKAPGGDNQRITRFLARMLPVMGGIEKPRADEIDDLELTANELACAVGASNKLVPQERAYWARVLESIAVQVRWTTLNWENPEVSLVELRDLQMARNLISLVTDRYPNRKFIVWAASTHIARNLDEVEIQDTVPSALILHRRVMGDHLWKQFHGKMYSFGFTAYEGEFGAWSVESRKLETPSPNSLEDLLARADMNNAILDFRHTETGGEWLQEKLKSRPFGYSEMLARWSKVFDGMIFTKVMTASTKSID